MLPYPDPDPDPASSIDHLPLLRVETSCHVSDPVVVTPVGEADVCTVPTLREFLQGLLDSGHRQVVVDLDRLSFMDAVTLNLLVETRKRLCALGGELHVRCHTRLGRRLLRATGLEWLMEPSVSTQTLAERAVSVTVAPGFDGDRGVRAVAAGSRSTRRRSPSAEAARRAAEGY